MSDTDKVSPYVVSDKFWMYWVLAAPLTIVSLGLWFFYHGRLRSAKPCDGKAEV